MDNYLYNVSFYFFGSTAKLYGKYVFHFVRNYQTPIQCDTTILHFHRQYDAINFLFYFILSILVDVWWQLRF